MDVRSKELDNTAVPLPFQVYATMCTVKYVEAEKLVHRYIERFTDRRIRNNREFFNVKPEEALEIFYDVQLLIDDAVIEVHQSNKNCSASTRKQAKKAEHIFYCRRGGCDASGYLRKDGNFIVLAGSLLRSNACDASKPGQIERRNAFIEAYCTQTNEQIVLKQDYAFGSPSTAATIFIGGNANGWTEWKDAEGTTLDQVFRSKKE